MEVPQQPGGHTAFSIAKAGRPMGWRSCSTRGRKGRGTEAVGKGGFAGCASELDTCRIWDSSWSDGVGEAENEHILFHAMSVEYARL